MLQPERMLQWVRVRSHKCVQMLSAHRSSASQLWVACVKAASACFFTLKLIVNQQLLLNCCYRDIFLN